MLSVSCASSGLDRRRPAGPEAFATFAVAALRATGEVDVLEDADPRAGGATLSLDGVFRSRRDGRTVTAVTDVGHLVRREAYSPAEWLRVNWTVASAVRRSDAVLVPSQAVGMCLAGRLGVPSERIAVLEPRPAAGFRRRSRDEVAELRTRLGLPPRYLLALGTRSRRRNLGVLARAWAEALPRLPAGCALVLAGKPAGGARVPGALDVGYVQPEDVPALLSGALAWLGPSLYAGSALGALEAIACGAPPIVAATGAQPHAVGRAGIVVEAGDVGGWAEAIVAIAGDPDLRASLAAAGLRLAAEMRERPPDPGPLLAVLRG